MVWAQPTDMAYELAYVPTQGESWRHDVEYRIKQEDATTVINAKVEHEVVERRVGGGYDLQSKTVSRMISTPMGEIIDDREAERVARIAANEALISIASGADSAEAYRQALLTRFVEPPSAVTVGDTWGYSRPAGTPRANVPGLEVQYRFSGLDDAGRARVTFDYKETGDGAVQTGSGTWFIDLETGRPSELRANIGNFLGEAGTSATITLTEAQPES